MDLWVAGCGFSSRVGAGLGGNCDCRCGILYCPMLGRGGVVFAEHKLYGEVNSFKNTTINIWLNDCVY